MDCRHAKSISETRATLPADETASWATEPSCSIQSELRPKLEIMALRQKQPRRHNGHDEVQKKQGTHCGRSELIVTTETEFFVMVFGLWLSVESPNEISSRILCYLFVVSVVSSLVH